MVAALKLETRGDPVRVLVAVLLGGLDGGEWESESRCCYTAAREDKVKRNWLRDGHGEGRGERW